MATLSFFHVRFESDAHQHERSLDRSSVEAEVLLAASDVLRQDEVVRLEAPARRLSRATVRPAGARNRARSAPPEPAQLPVPGSSAPSMPGDAQWVGRGFALDTYAPKATSSLVACSAMSVNFNVRHVALKSVHALRLEPALTTLLCDRTLDFDPARYEEAMLRAVPAPLVDAFRASTVTRRDSQVAAQKEIIAGLDAKGITREDVGVALYLEQSWWGMDAMIELKAGLRVLDGDEGEAIGNDVGYGPARLLSPTELPPIVAALDRLTREAAEPRFRIHEQDDATQKRSINLDVSNRLTDEEFEQWAWQPLCALREYVRKTTDAGAWLLKWYD